MKHPLALIIALLLAHRSFALDHASGLVPNGSFELEDNGTLA